MISQSVLLARLACERRQWRKRELPTNFMDGVLTGLLIASLHTDQLWRETKEELKRNPNYISACISSLYRRKRSKGA